jgi:hypothetical protein
MTRVKLIILHRGNTPEIVESLIKESNALNINSISFDISKNDNIALQDNFYLFYSVLPPHESKSYIPLLSEKSYLIYYTFGRAVVLSQSKILKAHIIPSISIRNFDNSELLKKINKIGGFPIVFSSDQFSNSRGKYYIENKDIFLQVIDTVREKEEFDYILKYIEHDFHIRVYIINYCFNSAVIYYKDKKDYSTNRLDSRKRPQMVFCTHISPDIQQLAIHYSKCLHVETAGIDILVSRNNEYYLLEANNPMMYHVVPQSLPIVSKAIVQGLLSKYKRAFANQAIFTDSLPPLVVLNESSIQKKEYLEALFTCKEWNAPLVSQEEAFPGDNHVFLNSNDITSLNKQSLINNKLLKKYSIYQWSSYLFNISSINNLTPGDLEKVCKFPVLLNVEIDGIAKYVKVDTVKQCISLILIYQDSHVHWRLYPYIYIYIKRKVLLVASEIISIIEYQSQTSDIDLITSTQSISLDKSQISRKEYLAFRVLSKLLNKKRAWILEYLIDIKSNMYILSYQDDYPLDEFRSSSSDLLIPHIIDKLFMIYLKLR